jgi:YVTN family beta-propeller protein
MHLFLTLVIAFFGTLFADKAYIGGHSLPNYDATIFILDTNTNLITGVVSDLPAELNYIGDIAFSPNGKIAYAAIQAGYVYIIDVATDTYIGNVAGTNFNFTSSVAFSPDGTKAYATNPGNSTISIIDVATHAETGTVTNNTTTSFETPNCVAFSKDGSFAYIADNGGTNNSVYVVTTATNTADSLVTGAQFYEPSYVAFSPDGTYAYISDRAGVYSVDSSTHVAADLSVAIVNPLIEYAQLPGFLPNGTKAFISSFSNPETVFSADTATNYINAIVSNTFGTFANKGPTQIGITYNGLYGYITCGSGENIYILGTSSGTVTGKVSVREGVPLVGDTQAITLIPKPLPPTSLSGAPNTNNFGLMYELYNTLSWDPSNSLVSFYQIYRNGNLIGRVPGETLTFQDHNAPKGSSTYSITSIDSSGVEGTPISLTFTSP